MRGNERERLEKKLAESVNSVHWRTVLTREEVWERCFQPEETTQTWSGSASFWDKNGFETFCFIPVFELSLEAKEYVRNHHVQQIKEKN